MSNQDAAAAGALGGIMALDRAKDHAALATSQRQKVAKLEKENAALLAASLELTASERMQRKLGMTREGLQVALMRHCAPQGAGNADLMALCAAATELGLNPLLKHVYLVKQKGGRIEITVGIDGVLALLHRNPEYVRHHFDYIWAKGKEEQPDGLLAVDCTIVRLRTVGGTQIEVPYPFRARMWEWRVGTSSGIQKRDGGYYDGPWQKWPTLMLSWKALRLAFRNAFGVSVIDESDQEMTPVVMPDVMIAGMDAAAQVEPEGPTVPTPQIPLDALGGAVPQIDLLGSQADDLGSQADEPLDAAQSDADQQYAAELAAQQMKYQG